MTKLKPESLAELKKLRKEQGKLFCPLIKRKCKTEKCICFFPGNAKHKYPPGCISPIISGDVTRYEP